MPLSNEMVACYVVRPAGASHEFLQLRRAPNDYMGGTWATVYGCLISPSETAWQAALRELREETGLVPRDFFRLGTARSFYTSMNDTTYLVPAFCAMVEPHANVQLNDEHGAFRWIERSQADANFMWATDRESIAELCRDILDGGACRPYLKIDVRASS